MLHEAEGKGDSEGEDGGKAGKLYKNTNTINWIAQSKTQKEKRPLSLFVHALTPPLPSFLLSFFPCLFFSLFLLCMALLSRCTDDQNDITNTVYPSAVGDDFVQR